MVFRRNDAEDDDIADEDDDGLNVVSGDDDEDDVVDESIFSENDDCWVCRAEPGRVGIDPTVHGAYDGEPVLLGHNCLEHGLKDAYAANDGIAVIVQPFGDHNLHLYYRLDEMPAYQFPREDVEPISWLLLTIGDKCARCGEQSHFAWLTPDFVDPDLPEEEDRAVFRNLDRDIELLCRGCTATALADAYRAVDQTLLTVELPRGAMGILMPSGA